MEMLEHSNRRSRFSFFNIEMMETLRHRESTRDGRRGDCARGRRAGPEAAVLLSGGYPPARSLAEANRGKPAIGGARLAWRRGRLPARRLRRSSCQYIGSWMRAVESTAPEGSAPRAPGPRAASHAGRGEAPARCRPPARTACHPPALRRAGVVGILCAGGFPARAVPGARIIPNSPPRRAEARRAGRPAARGTAGKNFLKKVLDTAERAR